MVWPPHDEVNNEPFVHSFMWTWIVCGNLFIHYFIVYVRCEQWSDINGQMPLFGASVNVNGCICECVRWLRETSGSKARLNWSCSALLHCYFQIFIGNYPVLFQSNSGPVENSLGMHLSHICNTIVLCIPSFVYLGKKLEHFHSISCNGKYSRIWCLCICFNR